MYAVICPAAAGSRVTAPLAAAPLDNDYCSRMAVRFLDPLEGGKPSNIPPPTGGVFAGLNSAPCRACY